jgi:hypothetical protein
MMRLAMRKCGLVLAVLAGWMALSGFDLSRHSVPIDEILGGGPPKDGIPAIVTPGFVSAREASFLAVDDRVIGVVRNGQAKAYPLRILNWHEIVNDRVAGDPLAITYCPLTASAIVYDRRLDGHEITFGVSGLLYQSNLLMYDKTSDSLWSQLGDRAVAGPMTGRKLGIVGSEVTSWGSWRTEHPDTLVLSRDTGFGRDYERDPYDDYAQSESLRFPVSTRDRRLPLKEPVLGIAVGKDSIAVVVSGLGAAGKPITVAVGGKEVTVRYDVGGDSIKVVADGRPIIAVRTYWFAWTAFHPDTRVWGEVPNDELKRRRSRDALERIIRGGP